MAGDCGAARRSGGRAVVGETRGAILLRSGHVGWAEAMGMVGGLLVCVWAARWLWRICFGKPARTPVGPLSADDRVKARAKLLRRN